MKLLSTIVYKNIILKYVCIFLVYLTFFVYKSDCSEIEYVKKSITWIGDRGNDNATPRPTIIAITFGIVERDGNSFNLLPMDLGFKLHELDNSEKVQEFLDELYSETGISSKELSDSGFVPFTMNTRFELTPYRGGIPPPQIDDEMFISFGSSSNGTKVKKEPSRIYDDYPSNRYTAKLRENSNCDLDPKLFETGFTIYYARKLTNAYSYITKSEFVETESGLQESGSAPFKFDLNAKTFFDLFYEKNTSSYARSSEETEGGYYWTGGCSSSLAEALDNLFTEDELKSIVESGINNYGLVEWNKNMWRISHMWPYSISPLLDKWPKVSFTDNSYKKFINYYKDVSEVFEGAVFKEHGSGLDSILYARIDSTHFFNEIENIQNKINGLSQNAIVASKAIGLKVSKGSSKVRADLVSLNYIINELYSHLNYLKNAEKLREDILNIKSKTQYKNVYNQHTYSKLIGLLGLISSKSKDMSDVLSKNLLTIQNNLEALYIVANKFVDKNNTSIMNTIRNSSEGTMYYMEPPRGIDYEDMYSGEKLTVVGGYIELIKKGMYDLENMKVVVNKIPEPYETNTPFSNATSKFKSRRIAASIGYGSFQFSTGEMSVPLKYIVTNGIISYPRSIEDLITFFE